MPGDPLFLESAFQEIRANAGNRSKYDSRLNFLYKVVEDTQNTIRFLDTKAAFCVTLLSGMVAAVVQHPMGSGALHRALYDAFIVVVVVAVLVCLRVIFPTIKPTHSLFGARGPKFFIGHNKAHHWLLHTLRDNVGEVLNETHKTYVASVDGSTDYDLLNAMCDEVLMVALIRQVKSDRLHAAMFCLAGSVVIFTFLMVA